LIARHDISLPESAGQQHICAAGRAGFRYRPVVKLFVGLAGPAIAVAKAF